MRASSLVAVRQASSGALRSDSGLSDLTNANTAVVVEGEPGSVELEVVLDPLSNVAAKLAPILMLLREVLSPYVTMKVVLNPKRDLTEVPLKSFFRFALPSATAPPTVVFNNLPPSKTLTMHVHVPEAWLVEPAVAAYDLDNLRLEDLGDAKTMTAVFELEALLLTGHAVDKTSGQHPRGMQLVLGTPENPNKEGTVVMSNLGYFQLKASPGIWDLRLAPGRSSELYTFDGSTTQGASIDEEGNGGGDDYDDEGDVLPPPADALGDGEQQETVKVAITDFSGKVVKVSVVKRPGYEYENVLDDKKGDGAGSGDEAATGGGIMSRLFGGKGGSPAQKPTINIFSVASGWLYERFLKIMILSVLKNTDSPVKFWFIKNYLSPKFKEFIPHMAKEYGFEYELIQYKWPSWLNKQTDKQRIIWANKVLFLDVLFPLTLDKVIFVDADQIVRTDMQELYSMDLHGYPLAYTPFCDNNKDMDGFRFWKQGFWKSHLGGRPYHISALYVVDLARFRKVAAGDQFRVIYDNLSRDPNSLANLDQDLPNYAQHQVPIFSLPQEWLWCESWCGNATKAKAKTIDLCNNPLTKEPKLEGAHRIVKEWPALDEEQREFTSKVETQLREAAAQLPAGGEASLEEEAPHADHEEL